MTEPTVPPPVADAPGSPAPVADVTHLASADGTFRWRAFFRRAAEPLFVLDRRQRLLFVNAAWEALTGVPASDALRLVCRRPRPAGADDPPQAVVEHALTPPPEARRGATTRVRRLLPGRDGRRWWDVDFFPLRQAGKMEGVLILGRITPVAVEESAAAAPLPERLVALRERMTQRYGPDLLTGAGSAMRRLTEQVRLAAQTTVPVLLVGEPGTGKQTLARFIHYQGPARERPFGAIDCARLPTSALEEILFGSFYAHFGTVYLREPSRLPRDLQLKVSARLQDAAGPRLIAGCGADPLQEVRAGRLIEELYASLAVLTVSLPPLRERTADLPALVDRLLEALQRGRRTARRAVGPGRVGSPSGPYVAGQPARVVRGAVRGASPCWRGAHHGRRPARVAAAAATHGGAPGRRPERPLPLDALLEQAERRLIEMALERAGGKKHRAAEILAIWRARLIRRMKALGIGDADAEGAVEE